MKSFRKKLLSVFFVLTPMGATAGVFDSRLLVAALPTRYVLFHEGVDRRHEIRLAVEASSFVDSETPGVEIGLGRGRILEFYERLRLTPDSFLEIGERRLRLSCLWIQGQHIDGATLLRRMIFVINNDDCHGPVTDLGDDRWDSYVELINYRPSDGSIKEGHVVLSGNSIAVTLTPLDWQNRPASLAGGLP